MARREYKFLYLNPVSQEQRLVEAFSSNAETILWDEKVDGSFPVDLVSKVGGLKRVGDVLEFDQTIQDATDAIKALRDAPRIKREQALVRLRAVDTRVAIPANQVADLISDLIEALV